ncbi:MAG: hypothetical protein QNJ63_27355 [Calothrix sp. MO_192.B10]|nr:hypothetical protein [Calothrix sp. MO_192.B10]
MYLFLPNDEKFGKIGITSHHDFIYQYVTKSLQMVDISDRLCFTGTIKY